MIENIFGVTTFLSPLLLAILGKFSPKRFNERMLVVIYLVLCLPSLYLYVFGLFWLWAVGGLIETPLLLSAWTFLVLMPLSKTSFLLKIKKLTSFFDKALVCLLISYTIVLLLVLTLCMRNLLEEGVFALHG